MSKRTMIIVGVVAAAVVVVFAAAILANPAPSTSANEQASTAGSGAAVKPTPVSENTTGATSGSATGTGTSTGGGAKTTASAPKTSGTGKGASATTPRVPLKGFKPVPQPKVPPKPAPTSPVTAVGEELAELTTQPGDTISGLAFKALPEGSHYKVTMSPYGFGPSNVLGSRLVMKVTAVTPEGGAPKDSKISGAIVLALMDTGNGGGVTKGGVYTATVTFVSDGSKLLPVLSKATAAK